MCTRTCKITGKLMGGEKKPDDKEGETLTMENGNRATADGA